MCLQLLAKLLLLVQRALQVGLGMIERVGLTLGLLHTDKTLQRGFRRCKAASKARALQRISHRIVCF